MKSNRANTSDMPSPTFTYATTYTVPRSSPMLSSSFTPFYPRSQQQIYHSQLDALGNHDAGCYASPQDFNDVRKNHIYEWPHGREFHHQQCYTSSGSDPYKVCWVANNGNVWGGGAWQSGNPLSEEYVYADDEADDSAYLHSDTLSYFAESPGMEQEFYACSTSNTASLPTVYPDPGATAFNVPQGGAQLEQTSCFSKVKENLTPSLKNSFIQDQSVPQRAFGKQGPAKSVGNEIPNAFSSCKLGARPFSIQVSSQMSSSFGITSPAVEPKMKQATTDMTESRHAQTDSGKPSKESCCSSSNELGLLEAVELKHSIQATSNSTSTFELIKGSNLNAPTMSISAEVNQKEADNRNSLSPQSSSSQLLSTSGQCPGMILPKHINAQSHHSSLTESAPLEQNNMGSLLKRPSSVTEKEGKPCVEAIDHEGKMNSSYILPGNAWLYLNGPQLLVKCIHNLSKVLVSSQSGISSNILDPTDCFAIENTICILSQRLYQSSTNEGNFCQDQSCHQLQVGDEQELNISDDKFNEEAGRETFQQNSSFLLEGMKHKAKTVSPSRVLENGAFDGLSKVTPNICVEGDKRAEQCAFVKKEFKKPLEDLLMLQCNVTKLQEEVAYERAESNATVTTYKKLWCEAQEALKVSSLEINELRAELASLKQDFTNLKHSDLELTQYDTTSCINPGGVYENLVDVKAGSSHCFTAQNFYSEASSKKPFPACSEVVTNDFAPESISNCRDNFSSCAKGEGTILRNSNQNGKRFEVSAFEPLAKHIDGTNIQDEVTQQLSLLFARQCLDLNKTDVDRNVEFPSSLGTSLTQQLSLLLARQGLDLNKTDADWNVESPSGLGTSLEASPNLPREGEALPPDRKGNHFIWSETSYMVNANKKIGGAKASLSCKMKPAFDANYGDYSLVQTQFNARNTEGMDVEDVNVNAFQEDEIEIICFKPGAAESCFTCLKEEPEWEHVVVNVLDDHKTSR